MTSSAHRTSSRITTRQHHCLVQLRRTPGLSAASLGEKVRLSESACGVELAELRCQGLVKDLATSMGTLFYITRVGIDTLRAAENTLGCSFA